ncbi:MAG: hypothetical protein IE909_04020 [Campylobacterales bacterium]|nr:hypothetical protein [Campylobacterales bacterium]
MIEFYEQLLEHDLNPYLLFDSSGKVKSYNKEAEFLMNFVGVKELFDLAVANASLSFGFNHKYISLKYNKQTYYAILVGYLNDDEIALRLYKSVSNQTSSINNDKLKLVNIFSLIELSKNSVLLNSDLQIHEVYDVSIPELKININDFLLCLNDCFLLFKNDKQITLQVQIKIGEYEIINNKKHKIVSIEFTVDRKIEISTNLEKKAQKANANIFFNHNHLQIELPIIL